MKFFPQFCARIFGLPAVHGQDPDSVEALATHRRLLRQKKFLRKLYGDFYDVFRKEEIALHALPGHSLEIGSGGGFLKEYIPDVITSDLCAISGIDRTLSADRLPWDAQTLKAIYMLNVLHHLSDPEAFFHEAQRCLVPGGRLVMIEPFNSLWGRFFYKTFHHEPFEDQVRTWALPPAGRMSGANVALPWIIFWRDRALFEQRFPQLRIRSIHLHNVITYLLSGGLSFRAVVPAFTYSFFRAMDSGLSRYTSVFPIFQTIVIEKP